MRRLVADLVRHNCFLLLAVVVLALCDTAANIAAAWSAKTAMDAAIKGGIHLVVWFSTAYVVIYVFKYFVGYLSAIVSGMLGQRITFSSELGLLRKVGETPLISLYAYGMSDQLSKICNEVPQLLSNITLEACGLITNLVVVLGTFLYLFRINRMLAIICFLFGPILALSMRQLSVPVRRLGVTLQQSTRQVGSYIQNIADGLDVAKTYDLERMLIGNLEKLLQKRRRDTMIYAIANGLGNSVLQLLGYSPLIAVLGVGGWSVAHGHMTPGDLMAFITLFDVFVNPIIRMSSQGLDIQKHLAQLRDAQSGMEGWYLHEGFKVQ